MTIRDFKESDRELYCRMAQDFYGGDGTLFPVDEKNFNDTVDYILTNPDDLRGCIIEHNGETVGYALLVFFWSCEAGGKCLLLDELYLLESVRGQGIGSKFMEWLEEEYSGKVRRMRLEVCPKNPRVQSLYKRYGFEMLDYKQMVLELPEK